jgi:BirA family biotin operon repressor/biotin-[acetyl-CoA-carboxylase] ligase
MPAFDLTCFHELLQTREFGRNLLFEPTVRSTMDLARDAAAHGAAEGTLALTDEQTAGRGRLGRSWITPPALNLASTLLLRPPAAAVRAIPMITPLAIVAAVEEMADLRCDIKWPNDVQIDGKKLAGILIETELDADPPLVLVGAGINVNFDPRDHAEIRAIATSLLAATGREHDREALLGSYLLHAERLYDAVKSGTDVRDRWRERLITVGQRVTATTPSGVTEGVAEDVDTDGALLIRKDDGALATVEAGDVTLRE